MITAMSCSQDCQTHSSRLISVSSMLLPGLSMVCGCMITLLQQRLIFTGYLLKCASSINCVCWYTTLSLGKRQNMSLISFNLSPPRRHVMQPCGRQVPISLFVPRTRLQFGERAFRVAAPKAWNQLPRDVRCVDNTNTFKKKLKTFYSQSSIFVNLFLLLFVLVSFCCKVRRCL